MSPANPAYVDLTGTYPHDVAKAKELLKEAGLENGFKATLKLPPPSYARAGGEIIASQLREVGIDARNHPGRMGRLAGAGVHRQGLRPDHRLAHRAERHRYLFAQGLLLQLRQPGLRQGDRRAEPHLRRRQAQRSCSAQAQKILADDAVVGFLFELPKIGVWDAKLQGLWENAPIQANDLTKVKWVGLSAGSAPLAADLPKGGMGSARHVNAPCLPPAGSCRWHARPQGERRSP